jgi:hypothetical protein
VHTHSLGFKYKFSTCRCWKKLVRPTRLYARCFSSPMTIISYSLLFTSYFINFSLVHRQTLDLRGDYGHTYMKAIPTIPNPTTTIFFRLPLPLISPFFSNSATFSGNLFASGSFHSEFEMLPSFDPQVALTPCSPGGECDSPDDGSMPCVTMGAVSAMMGSLCATTRLDAFTCAWAWRYVPRNTIRPRLVRCVK